MVPPAVPAGTCFFLARASSAVRHRRQRTKIHTIDKLQFSELSHVITFFQKAAYGSNKKDNSVCVCMYVHFKITMSNTKPRADRYDGQRTSSVIRLLNNHLRFKYYY